MASVNKVIIVGRLGQDPEVRQFQNGGSLTNISVATSERWTDKNTGEQKEKTEWHRIVLQNRGNYRLGDIAAQYLHKGSMVYIEGSLSTRKWTDQQGIERYATEIRADNMTILSSNQNNHQNQGQWNNQQNYQQNHQQGYPQVQQGQPQGYYNNQYPNNNPIQGIQSVPQMGHQNVGVMNTAPNTPNTPHTPQGNMTNAMSGNQFANQKPTQGTPSGSAGGIQDDDMPF